MGNLSPRLKSHKKILTSPKGVIKVLVSEQHISMIPFIMDGSKLYDPIDITTALRMATCLSLFDDFFRV